MVMTITTAHDICILDATPLKKLETTGQENATKGHTSKSETKKVN